MGAAAMGHFVSSQFLQASLQKGSSALHSLVSDLEDPTDSCTLSSLSVQSFSCRFLSLKTAPDSIAFSKKSSLGLEVNWFKVPTFKLYYSTELLIVFSVLRLDGPTQNFNGVQICEMTAQEKKRKKKENIKK